MNSSNLYPSKIALRYLYAIGGKSSNIVQKTIEKYDIERDEWTELRI